MKQLCIWLTVMMLATLVGCGESPSLTPDEALTVALEQAGVTRDSIRDVENHLDRENGVLVYEIDFEAGNTEYSYDVNAETGAVVATERETRD